MSLNAEHILKSICSTQFLGHLRTLHVSLGILTLEGQPPPRHLPTDSMGWWRGGICPSSQNAEACIHVDTGFLLVILCIKPFAKTSENENKVELKGILKISSCLELFLQSFKEMKNKVYKVLSEWKLDKLKKKFKGEEICRLYIYMYLNVQF